MRVKGTKERKQEEIKEGAQKGREERKQKENGNRF